MTEAVNSILHLHSDASYDTPSDLPALVSYAPHAEMTMSFKRSLSMLMSTLCLQLSISFFLLTLLEEVFMHGA